MIRVLAQFTKLCAHHLRAYDVDFIRAGELVVVRVCVARRTASTDHVYVDLRDYLVERNSWIVSEVTRSPQALFFAAVPDKQHRTFGPLLRMRDCLSHSQQRRRA